MVKFRLFTPREFATRLRDRARLEPRRVEAYLDEHPDEWEALASADPHDAADILEELGEEAALELIRDLDPAEAAEVLDEIRTDLAADILERMEPSAAAEVLGAMQPEEAADVIGALPIELRATLFHAMDDSAEQEVMALLSYPPDSAGGLMTTDVAALPIGMTAGEAIETVRRLHEDLEDLSYIYIVDDRNVLVGVLSFRDLVFGRPGVGLEEVMIPNPVSVTPLTDREQVAELTQRYNLFGIPVVEENGVLLGMVNTEAVLEAIQQEASEDFAAAMGAGAMETAYSPVWRSVRNRVPWLITNLVLTLGTMTFITRFAGLLQEHPELAALMPLVATLGGNAGAQSLAVIIRSIATDDVPRSEVAGIFGRQIGIGVLNGIIIGAVSWGVIAVTSPALSEFAVIVAVAAFANLVIATLAGAAIPLLLRAVGLDPALASNIFVTLLTDLTGFGGFLALAAFLL